MIDPVQIMAHSMARIAIGGFQHETNCFVDSKFHPYSLS